LIRLSRGAERQLSALLLHYVNLERPEACRALLDAIDRAMARIERDPSNGIPAPRPYPRLARTGELWMKSGRYWIAYSISDPPIILGVFYDAADIPRRY